VVDPKGRVVARGRNRVYEPEAPRGQLADSLLAHAEVNALAGLSPVRRYEDHAVFTALEPCILCIGATRLATVGAIRYAGPDPYGGAAGLALDGVNPMLDRLGPEISGPELGALGLLFAALHAEFFLRRNPTGRVVEIFRAAEPRLVHLGEALQDRDAAELAARGVPLDDALVRLGDVVGSEP
jgi:tRNA(Arg) A34 adenosine deaminase TadA